MRPIAEYWRSFAVDWESSSYRNGSSKLTLVEKIATYQRGHIVQRKLTALKIFESRIAGKNIMEIGCGTGGFAFDILDKEAQRIIGMDVSEKAIAIANETAKKKGLSDKATFVSSPIESFTNLPDFNVDLIVGLGILEYLEPIIITNFIKLIQPKELLFSFDEKRISIKSILHIFYRKLKHLPYYIKFSETEIRDLFSSLGYKELVVARERGNSFIFSFRNF